VPCLDENQSAGVEAELSEPVAVRLAEVRETAVCRHEDGGTRTLAKHQGSQGEGKTEGGGLVAVGGRSDLMQRVASEAGAGQIAIDLRQAERQICAWCAERCTLHFRHRLAKRGNPVCASVAVGVVGRVIVNWTHWNQ
jgi:hypothetical protein